MREQRCRYCLGILAVLTGLFVFYASLVPLRYQSLLLSETWVRFQQIPWLPLGLEKRADWVANGLILIPLGFLLTGFLTWRRSNLAWKLLSFVLFAVFHSLFVGVIEFVQIWFPPRVVSLNDMLAGYVGGISGATLWHMVGDRMVDTAFRFASSPRGLPRIVVLAQYCATGLLLYGLLPFDVMFTPEEWSQKVAHDRVTWIPLADWQGIRGSIKSILLCGWAFPLGVVLGLQFARKDAIRRILGWSVAIELVSLPIFHRHTSVTDIIVAAILGVAGVWLAEPTRRLLNRLDLAGTWWIAAVAWTIVIFVGFTVRFERFVSDQSEWVDRLWGILAVPFARAHGSSEFEAAENVLIKLLVFGVLGFLLTGWGSRRTEFRPTDETSKNFGRWVLVMSWIAVIGIAVEISQAFLFPLVPDITDLLLYSVGAVLGANSFRLLIPKQSMLQEHGSSLIGSTS